MVAIVYSEKFLLHETGRHHPERPARVSACAEALRGLPLDWLAPRLASLEELAWIHPRSYLSQVEHLAQKGGGMLDADTPLSPASYEVARFSAGAWLVGVDQVVDHKTSTFVLARPPGHHARPDQGMGFCIFGNAALAAYYAIKVKKLNRVAVLDWDVHHGNGTQEMLENQPQMAYCSLHQLPCYPGTGFAQEEGLYKNILNIPLAAGTSRPAYRQVFSQPVIPFLAEFAPDLLIISAGFDATRADPLAQMLLEPEDYAYFTQQCLAITPQLLIGLEGGYDLDALSQSVVQVVQTLIL